jgi:hypothetical protein
MAEQVKVQPGASNDFRPTTGILSSVSGLNAESTKPLLRQSFSTEDTLPVARYRCTVAKASSNSLVVAKQKQGLIME